MGLETNAILAINSLDRYAGQPVRNSNRVNVRATAGLSLLIINAGTLTVGGEVYGWVGLQPDTFVISVSPLGTQAQISKPATLTNAAIDIIQTVTSSSALQPVSNSLNSQYSNGTPPAYNFTIQSPGALIYGYINKMIVSQVQIQYNIPTICQGRNDTIYIQGFVGGNPPEEVEIPFGFYTPAELAAVLQVQIRNTVLGAAALIDVAFDNSAGFIFTSTSVPAQPFGFPAIETLQIFPGLVISADKINNILKTYRTLGITIANSGAFPPPTEQVSGDYPTFLYTPFIDICSEVLTNYQKVKDTNTSPGKSKGVIARVYLSGAGNPQITTANSALGSAPFVMTIDLNNPKVIRWSPDVAVPSIDLQVTDQYGEYIPGADFGFSTEFQMTLLCTEGDT
jgi:hypothetical protein